MCVVNSQITHCGNVVPGIAQMWIARREDANTFLYPNVSRTGLSLVNSITNNGAAVPWYEYYCEFDTVFNEELARTEQGGNFPQRIGCTFPQMDTDKRITLEQLINDRVCIIVKTHGSGYWLLGQEFGLKVTEYSASPGARSGANAYRVVFTSVGREQMRKVSDSFLSNVALNGGSGGQQRIVQGIGGTGPGGTVTNVLSTWGNVPLYQTGQQEIQLIIT